MYKRLYDFKKRFNKLKTVDPQTNENEDLKLKFLDKVGDHFNELYYNYRDKYKEEKKWFKCKYRRNLNYKKLRLTDDYQYESEEEEEQQQQQISKKPNKKELLKKLTKDESKTFNEWLNKEETDINSELF